MTGNPMTAEQYLAQAGFPGTTLPDLLQKLASAVAAVRNGLANAGQQVAKWYHDLVAAVDAWITALWTRIQAFWTSEIQPWLDEVKKIWDLVASIVRKCLNDLTNFPTNLALLNNVHADMMSWIQVAQSSQQWYQDVEKYHMDNGYNMLGQSSSRDWVGAAADSYASLWPYQVRAGQRVMKIAGENSANLGRLLATGATLYVAWGMVFLQLASIFAMDAVLARWRRGSGGGSGGAAPLPGGPEQLELPFPGGLPPGTFGGLPADGVAAARRSSSAGAGDVRTLLRLLTTVVAARVAVDRMDEHTAATMQLVITNRDGMSSRDRNWPNPLAVKEFLHTTIDSSGTAWIEAGRDSKVRD